MDDLCIRIWNTIYNLTDDLNPDKTGDEILKLATETFENVMQDVQTKQKQEGRK